MARKVEKSVEINAPADAVWRALTQGEELKRWFPLDARVTPGEGGGVWLSWGEGSEWESPIEIWKPNEHLRTVDTMPGEEGAAPTRIAVDYIIEGRGGTTTLRLVHSGFSAATLDDEIETMGAGWATFLANLKHYLEQHPGEPRTVAFYRHPVVAVPRAEAYARVMKALGIVMRGDRYVADTSFGAHFEGEVRVSVPPINFTGTVENLSNAFMMVEIEPGRDRCRPALWLSLYGDADKDAPEMQAKLQKLLESVFSERDAVVAPRTER
jgi:uncharacterized protein YndB with AHSA1/START domain